MKTFTCLLLGLCLSSAVFAQEEPAKNADIALADTELEKLVAPIALYPDSLVALILPASTSSADIVLAARFLSAEGEVGAIDNEPWSDSVKSLAHFPVVVKWMDENLAWTRQLGDVFLAQPADVMSAIQRVRAQAKASGLLTDTPEQRVVVQDDEICIVPARADIIYVPSYNAEVLWARRSYYGGPFITFGVGFGIGSWLFYDCDWPRRTIWIQRRAPGWVYHPIFHHPAGSVRVVSGTPWRPPHHTRPQFHGGRSAVVATRVHVDERLDRPVHDDFHQRGARQEQRSQVWRNRGGSNAPRPSGASIRAGRTMISPAPAISPTATVPSPSQNHPNLRSNGNRQVQPSTRSFSRVSSSEQTPTGSAGRTSVSSSPSSSTGEVRQGRPSSAPAPAAARSNDNNMGRGWQRGGMR